MSGVRRRDEKFDWCVTFNTAGKERVRIVGGLKITKTRVTLLHRLAARNPSSLPFLARMNIRVKTARYKSSTLLLFKMGCDRSFGKLTRRKTAVIPCALFAVIYKRQKSGGRIFNSPMTERNRQVLFIIRDASAARSCRTDVQVHILEGVSRKECTDTRSLCREMHRSIDIAVVSSSVRRLRDAVLARRRKLSTCALHVYSKESPVIQTEEASNNRSAASTRRLTFPLAARSSSMPRERFSARLHPRSINGVKSNIALSLSLSDLI